MVFKIFVIEFDLFLQGILVGKNQEKFLVKFMKEIFLKILKEMFVEKNNFINPG